MIKLMNAESKLKHNELLKEIYLQKRKEIFGNKTDVLNDGFYEKLSKKDIDQLKADGATSCCSTVSPNYVLKSASKRASKKRTKSARKTSRRSPTH
jgi:uncharacterized protein YjgD (DUF1641 family)